MLKFSFAVLPSILEQQEVLFVGRFCAEPENQYFLGSAGDCLCPGWGICIFTTTFCSSPHVPWSVVFACPSSSARRGVAVEQRPATTG